MNRQKNVGEGIFFFCQKYFIPLVFMQIYPLNGKRKPNQCLWISPLGLLRLARATGSPLCIFSVSLPNRALWKLAHLASYCLRPSPPHTHVFLPFQSLCGRHLSPFIYRPQDAAEHPSTDSDHLLPWLPGSNVFLYDVCQHGQLPSHSDGV